VAGSGKKKALPKRKASAPKAPSPVAALAGRFALDALERRVVEIAYELERSLAAAEAMRKRGGLTVERLRALAGAGVDAVLSPKRALRRHALVTVGSGGMAAASDPVRLAPGLAARLDGNAEPDGLWLGCARVAPGGRGDVPARIAPLVAGLEHAGPMLLTLDGCPRVAAHDFAAAVSRHTGRGVLVVDGELLMDAADPALLLACARREADCDGDVVVVCEASRLGERWRALLAQPVGDVAPLVVLADADRTREPSVTAPFAVRRLSLHPPAAPTAMATATAPTAAASEPRADDKAPPVDDGLGHIRQQAIRDAERALGIYRAPPPPPRAPVTPIPPPLRPPAPAPVEATPPKAEPPKPEPPKPEPPKPDAAARTEAAPKPESPAAAAASSPPPAHKPQKRSAKGALFFGGEYTAPPSPEPQPPPPAAPPPPAPDPASLANDGAPLPLSDSPGLDELARVAVTSPSAAQRIELINRLRTTRAAPVVAALRANAASAHPAVRAAAESAMAALFGPNWNTTRAIPKPVQTPPSDDKDRGPPGGW